MRDSKRFGIEGSEAYSKPSPIIAIVDIIDVGGSIVEVCPLICIKTCNRAKKVRLRILPLNIDKDCN